MAEYKSFVELVDACNTIVDDDFQPSHFSGEAQNQTFELSELTQLVLHDDKGKLRAFGYLTPTVVEYLPWSDYGFVLKGKRLTHPAAGNGQGRVDVLNHAFVGLVRDRMSQMNFPDLRGWKSQLVTIYGQGGGGIEIPVHLALMIGVARIVFHLTAYTESKEDGQNTESKENGLKTESKEDGLKTESKENGLKTESKEDGPKAESKENGLKIWVQVRSDKAALHGGKLEQTASQVFMHNDYDRHPLYRIASEEIVFVDEGNDGRRMHPLTVANSGEMQGSISYLTVRDERSEPLHDLPDASVRVSYAIKLPKETKPRPPRRLLQPSEYKLCTVDEVMESLLAGEWRPCSALVMIFFLIEKKCITAENEPGYHELVWKLNRSLPHAQVVLAPE